MSDACVDDHSNPPWDPLREQEWASLSAEVDSMEVMGNWDSVSSSGHVPTHSDHGDDCDVLNISCPVTRPKVCLQFSQVAIDGEPNLDTNTGWPFGMSQGLNGPLQGRGGAGAEKHGEMCAMHMEHDVDDALFDDADDDPEKELSIPFQLSRSENKDGMFHSGMNGFNRVKVENRKDSLNLTLAIPDGKTEAYLVEADSAPPNAVSKTDPAENSLFPVHLFVTAIADGKILSDSPPKVNAVLEQVRKKVSKEQNTVVQVCNEGAVDLKMRVFVANSVEAKAVWDYISTHTTQIPAPFVVLSKTLMMAVSYDSSSLDPSLASVADRLRKQIKTHAVKVLREAIGDKACTLTTAMLRGYSGPMAPAKIIEPLVQKRATMVPGHPVKRFIILPAKNKSVKDEKGANGSLGSPKTNGRGYSSGCSSATPTPPSSSGNMWQSLHLPHTPRSPDTSAPSTPGGAMQEEMDLMWEGRLTAHFPVNLFVTAIADGEMARDTPPKVQERLAQIVRKVPKEQNTSVEVSEGCTIDLKMRVFVVNSEDAKAVGEYINSHMDQLPAPFVVLAKQLPMAVLYDPTALDLSDASVADRLRKQAKTRAVKVLREAIATKSLGITQHMLRGHCGAMQPSERLTDFLITRTQVLESDPKNRYFVFAARNKGCSVPCSPRKRPTPDSPPVVGDALNHLDASCENMEGGDASAGQAQAMNVGPLMKQASIRPLAVGVNRRGGAASASHLHRNMLDKAFNKKMKGSYEHIPPIPSGSAL